jgi:hypothetical protein
MVLSYENVAMGIMTADENMTVGERRKVLKRSRDIAMRPTAMKMVGS